MEDWALIRRLVADGVPKARIAARLGISRTTVGKAAASAVPPRYVRKAAATSFERFEDRVRQLLAGAPSMPATVVAERVGWAGSPSWFRENVARIRPEYRRVDPADRLAADVAAMLPLPTAPLHLGWRGRVRLGRDYYVPVAGDDYSVDPTAIGAMVEVCADLDRVRVKAGGRLVADHPRSWGSGQTITDPAHVERPAGSANSSSSPGRRPPGTTTA